MNKKYLRFYSAFLIFFFLIFLFPTLAIASSDWPKMYYNNTNTANTGSNLSSYYPTVAWNTILDSTLSSHPIIYQDKVYIGSDAGVNALNLNTGALLWHYPTTNRIYSSGAASEGVVYFGCRNGFYYALNADTGALVWSVNTGSMMHSSAVIVGDILYVGGYTNKTVYAFNKNTGAIIWTYVTGGSIFSSPAHDNGRIFIGSYDKKLYALDATTGAKLWDFTTGDWIYSGLSIAQGKVFIGARDSKIYAVDENDGHEIWQYTAGDKVLCAPAIDGNLVYADSWDNKIYALDINTGTKVWDYATADNNESSPGIADGMVTFGSFDKKLYGLNKTDGSFLWSYETGPRPDPGTYYGVVAAPAISDQKIIAAAYDWNVYMFKKWDLNVSYDKSYYYRGETMNITVTSSMLQADPITLQPNVVQAIMPDGTIVSLTYQNQDSQGNSIWQGTYTIPQNTSLGQFSVAIEAGTSRIITDQNIHTNSKGYTTGLTFDSSTLIGSHKGSKVSAAPKEEQFVSPGPTPEVSETPLEKELTMPVPRSTAPISSVPVNPSPATLKELKPDTPFFTSTQGEIIIDPIASQKPLNLVSGLKLKISIKPSKPAQTIKVIINFKKSKEKSSFKNNLLLSLVQSVHTQVQQVAEYTLTDEDGDGIFEEEIKMPEIAGEYVIKTTLYFVDGATKDVETEALIDPMGYIYQAAGGKEIRISDAKISLYRLNLEKNQFELWPAQNYGQENPQTTDKTGEYSFLVPEGKYYLAVTASNYKDYQSEELEAREGSVINRNIELVLIKKFNWYWLIFPVIGGLALVIFRLKKKYR